MAVFQHVVERSYVLRVCSCESNSTSCDCAGGRRSSCSDIITLEQEEVKVFDWCRKGRTEVEGSPKSKGATVSYPQVGCESAVLSGALASCTPVQDGYDKIRVRLHRQEEDRHQDGCGAEDHSMQGVLVEEVPLTRLNETHGNFVASFEDRLEAGGSYCLSLDLSDHPYCRPHIVIGHGHSYVPPVCHQHLPYPIVLEGICDGGTTAATLANPDGGLILTLVVLAVIVAGTAATVVLRCLFGRLRMRKHTDSREDIVQQAELEVERSSDIVKRPVLLVSCPAEGEGLLSDDRKVLFLHFDDARLRSACELTREWMTRLGCQVFDPSDDARQEEVASEQEEWTERLLRDEDCKVVIVEAASDDEIGGDDDVLLDPLRDLKEAAVRRLQSPDFVGNYRRVAVVSMLPAHLSSGCGRLSGLTSMRDMRLPEHLGELAEWLQVGARREDARRAETKVVQALAALKTASWLDP